MSLRILKQPIHHVARCLAALALLSHGTALSACGDGDDDDDAPDEADFESFSESPQQSNPDTFFDGDIDILFATRPKNQVLAILQTDRGSVVLYRNVVERPSGGCGAGVACDVEGPLARHAVVVTPEGTTFVIDVAEAGASTTAITNAASATSAWRAGDWESGLLKPLFDTGEPRRVANDDGVPEITRAMQRVVDSIRESLDQSLVSQLSWARKLSDALAQYGSPDAATRYYQHDDDIFCKESFGGTTLTHCIDEPAANLGKLHADDAFEVYGKPPRDGAGGHVESSGITEESVRLVVGDRVSTPVAELKPTASFTCVGESSGAIDEGDSVNTDERVICRATVSEDGVVRLRWEYGATGAPPFTYENREIGIVPRVPGSYSVTLTVTDRNTKLSARAQLRFNVYEKEEPGEDEDETGNESSGDTGELCYPKCPERPCGEWNGCYGYCPYSDPFWCNENSGNNGDSDDDGEACVPNCNGKACGDSDGCGSYCGSCT